jgi:glycosyltransferase involved in cell wall biosynthesis
VGGLVERKGFHRVIEVLPALIKQFPELRYLIVGGPSAEGDWTDKLMSMVQQLKLTEHVQFLGIMPPTQLKEVLSAADVFVLSTRNEGWANVILESMACGVPVIASDVGGNAEVISNDDLGLIIPFNDSEKLYQAIKFSLTKKWHKERIIAYAQANSWDNRVACLNLEFNRIVH